MKIDKIKVIKRSVKFPIVKSGRKTKGHALDRKTSQAIGLSGII